MGRLITIAVGAGAGIWGVLRYRQAKAKGVPVGTAFSPKNLLKPISALVLAPPDSDAPMAPTMFGLGSLGCGCPPQYRLP